MKEYKGILNILRDISEDEILNAIKKYRKKYPEDKRSDAELRPYISNGIYYSRSNKNSKIKL